VCRCADAQVNDDTTFKPSTREEEEIFHQLEMKLQHEKRETSARKIWTWYQRAKARIAGREVGEMIRSEKLCSNLRLGYYKSMTGF
jgi:hypothetical protein